MKRLVVYYSLSGTTERIAQKVAQKLNADIERLELVKPMPTGLAAQILVGGGQVIINYAPKIKPINANIGAYDEIIIGTPIWNGKAVPAITTFLRDYRIPGRITSMFFLSGSGRAQNGIVAMFKRLPELIHVASLYGGKRTDCKSNEEEIENFVEEILSSK